jgi:hypothetical protein
MLDATPARDLAQPVAAATLRPSTVKSPGPLASVKTVSMRMITTSAHHATQPA